MADSRCWLLENAARQDQNPGTAIIVSPPTSDQPALENFPLALEPCVLIDDGQICVCLGPPIPISQLARGEGGCW
jgi:hypothetical protein